MSVPQAFEELADILELDDVQDLFEADPIIRDSSFHILKYHSEPERPVLLQTLTIDVCTVLMQNHKEVRT